MTAAQFSCVIPVGSESASIASSSAARQSKLPLERSSWPATGEASTQIHNNAGKIQRMQQTPSWHEHTTGPERGHLYLREPSINAGRARAAAQLCVAISRRCRRLATL